MKLILAETPYSTFQGEQPLLGLPIRIVRFSGCNLAGKCPLDCDTKYSWKNKVEVSLDKVIDPGSWRGLMITGGEPFLHKEEMFTLVRLWSDEIHSPIIIETNGTLLEYIDLFNLDRIMSLRYLHQNLHQKINKINLSISPKTLESFRFLEYEGFSSIQTTLKVVVGSSFPPPDWYNFIMRAYRKHLASISFMPMGVTPEEIRSNLSHIEFLASKLNIDEYLLSPRMHIFLRIP